MLLVMIPCCGRHGAGESAGAAGWTSERSALDRKIMQLTGDGRYEEAVRLADSLISIGVRDSRILGQKAHALGGLGRFEESVPLFEEALIKDYENCDNHVNFAIVLMRMGKTGRAITELSVGKRFCGAENMSVIYRNLAVAHIKSDDEEGALRNVLEGLGYKGDDRYLLGLKAMLIAESSPAAAESLFADLDQSGELPHEFLYQYGLMLIRTNRPVKAASMLGKAVQLRPRDRDVRLAFAEALVGSGRRGEAEDVLRSLIGTGHAEAKDERDLNRARGKLADLLFLEKRFEEAAALYVKLPQSPETMDRIAMCYHGRGLLDDALAWERRAIEKRPEWTTGMINLAVILAARGDLDEAYSTLKRVIEIDPDNFEANTNLERLRRAMEDAGR
jgi:tetratricopeptide (TPR) repeat protein